MQSKYQDRLKELNAVLLTAEQVEWFYNHNPTTPHLCLNEHNPTYRYSFDEQFMYFRKADIKLAQSGATKYAVSQEHYNLLLADLRNAN